MSKGEKTANNGKKDKNNSTFSFGRGLFIYLGVIYLALFRWLTSPLGQLASHRDGASGKRAVSTGAQERCCSLQLSGIKRRGHAEMKGLGMWVLLGSSPQPILCPQVCRGRGTRGKLQVQSSEVALLSPWVPLSVCREHVIGGATAWLLLSASVQSLPAACPVLFCTFLRGFLPLLLQHESVAVAFLVCSIVSVPNLVSVLNIFFLRSAVTLLFRGHAWRWADST